MLFMVFFLIAFAGYILIGFTVDVIVRYSKNKAKDVKQSKKGEVIYIPNRKAS